MDNMNPIISFMAMINMAMINLANKQVYYRT